MPVEVNLPAWFPVIEVKLPAVLATSVLTDKAFTLRLWVEPAFNSKNKPLNNGILEELGVVKENIIPVSVDVVPGSAKVPDTYKALIPVKIELLTTCKV